MKSYRIPCPLCKAMYPAIEMIYDESRSGYRAKATCISCGLEVMSDTFPAYAYALEQLLETWGEIKKSKK